MKQLLFLLLFPAFALAQYQGNANQKITLGEQTTADGLVWRGIRADTTSKIVPFSDTSAYIILDTVEKTLWLYKAGQVPKWQQVGGSTLDTATMLLPYYRAGRNTIIQAADVPTLNQNTTGSAATLTTGRTIQTNLASTSAATFNGSANITPGITGVLPVANGGTGSATQNFVDLTTTQSSIGGVKTFTSVLTATRFNPTANTATGTGMFLPAANTLGFSTNGTERMRITSGGGMSMIGPYISMDGSGSGSFTSPPSGLGYGLFPHSGVGLGISSTVGTSFWSGTTPVERMRIASGGNVGIGTTSPAAKLDVNGIAYFRDAGGIYTDLITAYSGGNVGIFYGGSGNLIISGGSGGSERMRITSGGNVGIGTTSPQSGYRLHVVDSVYVGGNVSASAYTTRSDYDLKDEIQNISYGINEVMQMQPVKYTYKSNGSTQLGFIAQDLGVITPEVVSFEDKMSVYYNALIPILTKAIQEQQALIKALEQRILILENK